MKLYELENGKIVVHEGLKVGDVVSVKLLEAEEVKVKRELALKVNEYDFIPLYKCEKVEPKINWFEPKVGEKYFCVDGLGNIRSFIYKKDEIDNKILKNTKIYRTREECELASDKQQAKIKILKRIAELNEGWLPNWEDKDEGKYRISKFHTKKEVKVDSSWTYQFLPKEWYLKSKELANQLINELEDELKLWYS